MRQATHAMRIETKGRGLYEFTDKSAGRGFKSLRQLQRLGCSGPQGTRRIHGFQAHRTTGEVAKRSNATDCKSVAPAASKVRILPSPPTLAPTAGRISDGETARCSRVAPTRSRAARSPGAPGGRQHVEGKCGSNSVVESQPSKLLVAGSIPVSRSSLRSGFE